MVLVRGRLSGGVCTLEEGEQQQEQEVEEKRLRANDKQRGNLGVDSCACLCICCRRVCACAFVRLVFLVPVFVGSRMKDNKALLAHE